MPGARDGAIPVSVRQWHWHAVCPRCCWHAPALGGTLCCLRWRMCGGCGLLVSADWRLVRKRWVSGARWWWPGSWGRGVWEGEDDAARIGDA